MKGICVVLSWLAATFIWSAAICAQPGDMPDGAPDKPVEDEGLGLPADGVYVPDSSEALQKIRQAQRLAESKNWDLAAQVLHDVQSRYGNRVLADEPGLYISVMECVNEELSKWPAEGLAAYRRRYDDLARRAYQQAQATGSAGEMASVARRYWAASIGPQAADEAAELALESGEFSTATDLWARLLTHQPGGQTDKPRLASTLAKLAVALAWNGQSAEARKVRDRLAKEFADWPNSFGPPEGTLLKWVEAYNQSLLSAGTRMVAPGFYPILGGGPDRTTVAPGSVGFGAEVWVFDKHKLTSQSVGGSSTPTGIDANGLVLLAGSRARKGQGQASVIIHPVLVDGVLYISSPAGVFAITADSGSLLWHNADYRPKVTAAMVQTGLPSTPTLHSPTYFEGRLYVDYGSPMSRQQFVFAGADSGASTGAGVVCLDAATGKPVWPRPIELDSLPGLRGAVVDSSPLVFGGRVFMVVHVARSVFDSCLLLAADARTGRMLWQQPISEADSGSGYYFLRSWSSLPAADGNTVYLATNLGTVAAVAADTGVVRWLRQYERTGRPTSDRGIIMPTVSQSTQQRREVAPTLFWNGRVIAAPPDCTDVLVLDAQTGGIIRQVSRKRDLDDAKEIYGIVDGKLYVRGNQVVCWNLLTNKRDWAISLDGEPTHRAWLSRQYLYIPTAKGLLRLDLDNKGATDNWRWMKEGSDGTILLSEQQILSANPFRIAGFCEWSIAQQRSLAAIAANPAKPEPYLVYAQHAYATGHLPLAKEQLAKAVDVAGGFAMLNDPRLKRQVFCHALDFARATWKSDPKATLELLQMASLCPPDVEGHVRYRLALARYWEDRDNLPEAVRYYQDVISDPTMRAAGYMLDDDDEAPRPEAGRFARSAIDRLIQTRGPAVYRAVADQADRDYDRAVGQQDWAEAERLVRQYPNADRTRKELFRLGEHWASAGDYEQAIGWLRFLRREYPQLAERNPGEDIDALARMAGYSLDLRQQWLGRKDIDDKLRVSRARRALRMAYGFVWSGRRHADARVTVAGQSGTFLEHRLRMETEHGKLLQMLPQVTAPLSLGQTITVQNGTALRPMLDSSPTVGEDMVLVRIFTGVNAELRGYRPAKSSEPAWTRKYDAQTGNTTNLIAYHEDLAVISQLNRVKGLNIETGEIAWTAELQNARQSRLNLFARHENLLLAVAQPNVACVVDMDAGKVQAELTLQGQVVQRPFLNDQYVSYVSHAGVVNAVVADWRTGRTVRQIEGIQPDVTWAGIVEETGALLTVGQASGLAAYDIATGRRLWQVAGVGNLMGQPDALALRGRMLYTLQMTGADWRVVARDVVAQGKVVWERPVSSTVRRNVGFGGNIRLILLDDELIAVTQAGIAVLDSDTGEVSWMPAMRPDDVVRDVLVAQDYLVLTCMRNINRVVRVGGNVQQMQVEVRLYDRSAGGGLLIQSVPLAVEGWGVQSVVPAGSGLVVQGPNKLYTLTPEGQPQPDN